MDNTILFPNPNPLSCMMGNESSQDQKVPAGLDPPVAKPEPEKKIEGDAGEQKEEKLIDIVVEDLKEEMKIPPPPSSNAASKTPLTLCAGGGLQIVTRKRSCLSNGGRAAATKPEVASTVGTSLSETSSQAVALPPPKKKKKYVAKVKMCTAAPKNPTAEPAPKKASGGGGGSKKKQLKSRKKTPPASVQPALDKVGEGKEMLSKPDKPKKMPPLKIQLPKLIKMPPVVTPTPPAALPAIPPVVAPIPAAALQAMPMLEPIRVEHKEKAQQQPHQDDNNDMEGGEDTAVGTSSKPSRKKKSKGRNGNIYIGVFNRIEWMKLQDEFGFQSVNNFGTFVLETMRKIYGDIQFWCDLAKQSGVYPELDKYVWKNGFPHAVNLQGEDFSPPELTLSEEKHEEVVALAKAMWEQRLEQLKKASSSSAVAGEGGEALAAIPEEAEEEDEDEAEDLGLENYLENMASGKCYGEPTPAAQQDGVEEAAKVTVEEVKMTEKQVNQIWKQQLLANPQNMNVFGKLYSFVNSIQPEDEEEEEDGEEDDENKMEEEKVAGGGVIMGEEAMDEVD